MVVPQETRAAVFDGDAVALVLVPDRVAVDEELEMKITMIENDGCFAFNMTAETPADSAMLVRFGANAIEKINSMSSQASKDGEITASLVIAKHKQSSNYLPRRR